MKKILLPNTNVILEEKKMPNMSIKKVIMPEQDPNIRNKNFKEVATGYSSQDALEEAERCLNCKTAPCVQGCPVNVKIPEFIKLIAENKFLEAYDKITETNSLPGICGRVCPQETQCEQKCVRAIKGESVAIGRLERFASDNYIKNITENQISVKEKNNRKVAVIGSGPAGLVCAGDLAKLGYDVTVFEAFHVPGGVLMYGIPEFRLPKSLVQKEIENVKRLGVKIKTNMVIGKVHTIDELMADGFESVFIGSGAGLPNFMGMPGENLNGVYSSNEFLTRINLMKAYDFPNTDTPVRISKNVAVIGGGNVAMDAARCAKRLGSENVYIVYRRSMDEMPARLEEIHHAEEEGIIFKLLSNPKEIYGTEDGWVKGMLCVEMELGESDSSGRRKPIEKKDSDFVLDVQTVIIAIGQSPNPLISSTTKDLNLTKYGGIVANEHTGQTSKIGVFAGGDAVTGAATVILAMGAGKNAAKSIHEYLQNL
jgi:glutamate synthase (NADPH/NADH) small chain